jgi:hypothetical protein
VAQTGALGETVTRLVSVDPAKTKAKPKKKHVKPKVKKKTKKTSRR